MNLKELRENLENKKDYFEEIARKYNLALEDMRKAKDELEYYYNLYLGKIKKGDILTFEKNSQQLKFKVLFDSKDNYMLMAVEDYSDLIGVSNYCCTPFGYANLIRLVKKIESCYECKLIETIF